MSEKKMMSKRKSIVASVMVMLLVFVTAFVGNMQANAAVFQLSASSWSVGAGGGSTSITVNSSHDWSIQSKPSWVSASGSGYTLSLSAQTNLNSSSRTGSVVLYSIGDTRTITITQSGNKIDVGTVPTLSASGASQTVSVTTGVGFTLGTPTESWLKVQKSGNSVILSADMNVGLTRSATFTINSGNLHKDVTVTQAANSVKPGKTEWTSKAIGESETISVTTGIGTFTATCSENWVTLTKTSTSVTITTIANSSPFDRTATVSLRSGNMYGTIAVTQKGNSITVGKESWTPEALAEPETISVTTGINTFSVSSNQSWLKVTKNGDSITASATINSSPFPRKGIITLRSGDVYKTVSVEQAGNTIEVSQEKWHINAKLNTINIKVDAAIKTFGVSSNCDWITVSKNDSYTSIFIKAQPNPTEEVREGIVTIRSGDVYKTIYVNQSKNILNVEESCTVEACKDSEAVVKVDVANGKFDVSTNTTWLSVSKEDGAVKITTKEANTSRYQREGWVTVTSGDITKKITVTQKGNSLTVGANKYSASADGGDLYTMVKVASGHEFYAYSNVDWITATVEGEYVHIKVAPNFDVSKRDGKVTITSCGMFESVYVEQSAWYAGGDALLLDPPLIYMDNAGGNVTVNVRTDKEWSIGEKITYVPIGNTAWNNLSAEDKKKNEGWVKITSTDKQSFTVGISSYEKSVAGEAQRSANITIKIDGKEHTVKIVQPLNEKVVKVTFRNFGGLGGFRDNTTRYIMLNKEYSSQYVPELKHDGYVFLGWFTDSGKEVTGNSKCVIDTDHTITARWVKVEDIAKNGSSSAGCSGEDIILNMSDEDKQWLLEYYEARATKEEKDELDDCLEFLYKDGNYEEVIMNIKLMAYSSDEPYRSLFFEYIGKAEIKSMSESRSYYSANKIYMKPCNSPDDVDWYTTFFHESFHAIDDAMLKDGYMMTRSTDEYYEAAKAETEAWMEAEIYAAKLQLIEGKKSDAEIAAIMKIDPHKMVELIMDPNCDGTVGSNPKVPNPYVEGTYEHKMFDELANLMTSNLRGSDISDTLDGYTNGLIGAGHWKPDDPNNKDDDKYYYYWYDEANDEGIREPTKRQVSEFWAEYGSAIMMSDADALSAYYDYYGETAELMNQLAEDNSQGGAN